MAETSFEKKINETYNRALKDGGLLYFENTVIDKVENDIEFQIRLAPSLAKKPTDNIGKREIIAYPNNANNNDKPKVVPKVDPFAPYDQQLFVEEYEKYIILLNKYCIIPKHLLVVTKEYESQANPLNPNDFDAFQSHKHMQILTLSDDPPMNSPIYTIHDKKPGEIFELAELPFIHYVSFIDPPKLCDNESSDNKSSDDDGPSQYLNKIFHSMLSVLIENLHNQILSSEEGENEEEGKSSFKTLSYNFIMTQKWMMIVPRCNSTHEQQIDINSLGFAGMLLAKKVAIPKKNL
ncbi:10915_t:CDS:2 [Diversispora eburnea]|uniref:10915_t:CDS:1 n=1 Tax=Diversispora eburnea TaxID=1213867 RepID=A0A9N8V1R2_9GLOM|nr:10915_t:CDS:2 [Diversispora eburnea]